ncbi:hypothetical protein LguiA_021067 [Lonicera macranthoides]
MSLANFSVSTQSHRLLSNFNPKGGSMKEFSIYLSSNTLVITFISLNNSFAFLNGLDVVSAPKSLFTDNAFTGIPYYEDFVTALAFHGILRVSIVPSTQSRPHNAFINGVEIMKMNDSMGSLCRVTNFESSSNTGSLKNVGLIVCMVVAVLVVYMVNGTHFYGSGLPSLGWKERLEISLEATKGLDYLHEHAVIHRDVKSSNILLDENLTTKVADFGILNLTRQLKEKSDVYSFEVVLFKVLYARPVADSSLLRERINLPKMALEWQEKEKIEQVIDPYIVRKIRPLSLRTFGETVASCLVEIGIHRTLIRDVIWNLERTL